MLQNYKRKTSRSRVDVLFQCQTMISNLNKIYMVVKGLLKNICVNKNSMYQLLISTSIIIREELQASYLVTLEVSLDPDNSWHQIGTID